MTAQTLAALKTRSSAGPNEPRPAIDVYVSVIDGRLPARHHPDQQAQASRLHILGPDHPQIVFTRAQIAHWTGDTGDSTEALRLYQELLPDRQRILGPDHPDILATRANIAAWTGQRGNSAEALRLYQELLPDLEHVLGPDHPGVLATRANMLRVTRY